MITIRVQISGVTHDLQVYKNDPINLNLRFTDIRKIQEQQGSYTKSFRIPANDNNFNALGDLDNANIVEGIDLKSRIPAELLISTVPVTTGFVQVKSIVTRSGKHAEYNITFFGDVVSLSRTLGDEKLKDIDFSAWNHVVNYANVSSSWTGSLFSGVIRYGLIDKGQLWSNEGDGNPITNASPVYAGQFTPAVRLPELLTKILEEKGFTIQGDFVDSDLNDVFIPFFNGKRYVVPSSTVEETTFGVGLSADDSFAGPQTWPTANSISNWDDSTSPFYDNGGTFNTVGGFFEPPFTGQYQFTCFVNVTTPVTNGFTQGSVGVRRISDSAIIWQSNFPQVIPASASDFIIIDNTGPLTLEVNEEYEMVFFWGAETGDSVTIQSAYSLDPNNGGTGFTVQALSEPLYGQTAVMSNNAPDIKLIDFIRGLQGVYNLLFIPDSNDPLKLTIETFADYTSGGAIQDWSDLINYKKDLLLEPTADIQNSEYQWTYAEEKDIINKQYQEQGNRTFGRYLIEEPDNDFATGELKLQVPFGAYPLSLISGTNLLIHKSYDEKGAVITDPLCKIVFWKYVAGTNDLVTYNDATGLSVQETSYPFLGHYSTPVPDVEDFDFNFGPEVPTHTISANPYNNLYNLYWRSYVNQLYSQEARIMTAYFALTAMDIANFEFSHQIWCEGCYWRVLEIDYTANSKDVSKVKLIKILGDVRACDWLPYQSNLNGVITMQDDTGAVGVGTQECCERFGYSWVNGACYQAEFVGAQSPPVELPQLRLSVNRGEAFANGENITIASASGGFVTGRNIQVSRGALRSLITGDDHTVQGIENIAVTGSNGIVFMEGEHRGNGWWYNNWKSGNRGYAQNGSTVLMYEGDLDSGDDVELLIEGKRDNRINIPSGTALTCRCDVQIMTIDPVSGNASQVEYLTFYEILRKTIAGVSSAFYSGDSNVPSIQFGDFGGGNKFRLKVDTATDTEQHRLLIHNHSTSNTKTTRVICKVNYLMAKL